MPDQVERFDPYLNNEGGPSARMGGFPAGGWVRYYDYAKLEAMNARLNSRESEQALVARQERDRADKAEDERDQAAQQERERLLSAKALNAAEAERQKGKRAASIIAAALDALEDSDA